jgi:uncharacterized membrane protein
MQYDGEACRLCGATNDGIISVNMSNALCYRLGPLSGMAMLAWSPYNRRKSVRFNALQSIFFFCAYVLVLFATGVFLPSGVRDVAGRTVQLAGMICWLYVIGRTFRGDKVVIPFIRAAADRNS